MVEAEIGFRFKAEGAEETRAKMAELFNQLKSGQIDYQSFRKELSPVRGEVRAVTQEANYMTQAWLAGHPAVLELTRSMSILGSVANAVTAAMNTVNLAILVMQGTTSKIQDIKGNLADAILEWQRFQKAFGDKDPRTEAALSKVNELLNQLAQAQREATMQSFGMWAAIIGGSVMVLNSLVQVVPKIIRELSLIIPAFARIGTAAGIALDFGIVAGVILASVYATDLVLSAISPQWAQTMKSVQNAIMKDWGADEFTAYLLRPFVTASIGLVLLGAKGLEAWKNMINGFLGAINTIIQKINSTFHLSIPLIPLLQYTAPTAGQIASSIGLPSLDSKPNQSVSSTGVSSATNPWMSGGSNTTVNVNVAGSIISEDQLLKKIDQYMKGQLRNGGWTG